MKWKKSFRNARRSFGGFRKRFNNRRSHGGTRSLTRGYLSFFGIRISMVFVLLILAYLFINPFKSMVNGLIGKK